MSICGLIFYSFQTMYYTSSTLTHLSVVNGRKPIMLKNSPMKTFSLNPTSPVAGDGLRRALMGVSPVP